MGVYGDDSEESAWLRGGRLSLIIEESTEMKVVLAERKRREKDRKNIMQRKMALSYLERNMPGRQQNKHK